MKGYIQLHRGLLDSAIFASEKGLKIWVWLLLKASYKGRHISVKIGKGESIVTIQRGELMFGRFAAEEQIGIDGSTIYKWIKKMEQMEMVTINSNSHYTIISICNYDQYNTLNGNEVTTIEQPSNNHQTAIEQPLNSHVTHTIKNKKVKQVNKVKKVGREITPLDIADKKFDENIEAIKAHYKEQRDIAREMDNGMDHYIEVIFKAIRDKRLTRIAALDNQVTVEYLERWLKKCRIDDIIDTMETINFYPDFKYVSLATTMNNWLKRDYK
jgi:hypothetical protein